MNARSRWAVAAIALGTLAAGAAIAAAVLWLTPAGRGYLLRRELDKSAWIRVDGPLLAGGTGPRNAKAKAAHIIQQGFDLFELYSTSKRRGNARYALAYFLLVTEDQRYLDYASAHCAQLFDDDEVGVWTFVLADEGMVVSAGFHQRGCAAVATCNPTYARFMQVAGRRSETDAEDMAFLLDLMVPEESLWKWPAFWLVERMDAEHKVPLLISLAEEAESARAAWAAYQLMLVPEHRQVGYARLKELALSSDPAVLVVVGHLLKRAQLEMKEAEDGV